LCILTITIFQEKCDEDLTNLRSDLQSKTQEYDRKEDALKAKRDSELQKLKMEFEQKVRVSVLLLLFTTVKRLLLGDKNQTKR
jgi:hypothetical protein